jgi:hypothetical protein
VVCTRSQEAVHLPALLAVRQTTLRARDTVSSSMPSRLKYVPFIEKETAVGLTFTTYHDTDFQIR